MFRIRKMEGDGMSWYSINGVRMRWYSIYGGGMRWYSIYGGGMRWYSIYLYWEYPVVQDAILQHPPP